MYKNQIHCVIKIAMTEGICQWFFVLTAGKKDIEAPRLLLREAGEWRNLSSQANGVLGHLSDLIRGEGLWEIVHRP